VVLLLSIGAVAQADGTGQGTYAGGCVFCRTDSTGATGPGTPFHNEEPFEPIGPPTSFYAGLDWPGFNDTPSGPAWNLGMDAGPGLFGAIGNRFMQFFRDEVIAWHQNYNSNHVVAGIDNVGASLRDMSSDPGRSLFILGTGSANGMIGPELPGAGEAPWSSTDVIFGLDPLGSRQLRIFQAEVGGGGGKRIVELWDPAREEVSHAIDREIRIRAIGDAPGKLRFNLDGIVGLTDETGAYGPKAPIWNLNAIEEVYGSATTAWELLGVKVWWRTGALSYDNVTFYLKGKPTSAPW